VDETTLLTLEFPSVLSELASFSMTPVGMEKVVALRPGTDIRSVNEAYAEYHDLSEYIKVSGTLPLGGVNDIRPVLSRIEVEGAYLLPSDLLTILSNITSSSIVKSLSNQSFGRSYPRTFARIERISEQEDLRRALNAVIDEKGEIKDTASTELFRIRREIRANKERARKILESITTDKATKEYLQEDIISIRDDRYVLAIKAGMHTSFEGVVHGRSGSGSTFFIEPMELVQMNNRVAILKKEEKAEEIEILKEATRKVALQRDFLLGDLEELSTLDLIQSKALFASVTAAIVPSVSEGGEVRLISARHPILIFKEKRGEGKVIPIDLKFPEDKAVLVISGANTGGKTVALKTLGLLTIMALSAIPVPAEEGSSIVTFREILADIGDRQDIIASLSTFSAHVKRMKEFLEAASPGMLVLIDEAGAGTDPSEGGAFALAAIETLRGAGARTVVTTHLNLLKAFAQADQNYLNASVEFDERTLRPLYALRYGVPGPSLGLSIAQSLGIPGDVITRARGYIKEKEGAFIESVRILEEEKEEVSALRDKLRVLEARKSETVAKLRQNRAEILERARKKIDSMVGEADREIREAIDKFRAEGKAAAGKKAFTQVGRASAGMKARLGHREKEYVPAEGEKVTIAGSSSKGEVITVDTEEKKAEVRFGNLKVWAPWDKLRKRGGDGGRASQGISVNADMEVATSLNIIGLRVDEAMPMVTRFIDNAHSTGMGSVEIIHGVGTGALSKAVEEFVRRNPAVAGFHKGGRGGGVTVVDLK